MIIDNTVREVKSRLDILDVVSSRIELRGNRCKCPFHDGDNLTMGINQKKQFYHCFKCGAAGDVISFIREYDGVSFSDAIITLCKQAGIQIDDKEPPSGKKVIPKGVKDILWMDSAVLQISEHDKKIGKRTSYLDKQRVKLAWSRIIGLSKKWI